MPSVTVLGAGPGGYAAAFYAADLGMQVTLVDEEKNPGGVCLYRGCIPSKALLHVAKVLDESKHAAAWGIEFGAAEDRPRQAARLQEPGGRQADRRHRPGRQAAQDHLRPGPRHHHRADHAVGEDRHRHAGGQERLPGAGDRLVSDEDSRACRSTARGVLDSTGALDLPAIPKTLLVVGGGYIGLELGSVYAALGTKVSVVEMTPGLLPGADRDLVKPLAPAHREDVRQGDAVDQGHRHGRRQERHRRDLRGRGRAGLGNLRLRADLDRPPAQLEGRRVSRRPG